MKTLLCSLLLIFTTNLLAALSPNEIVQKADLKRGMGTVSHSLTVNIANSNNKSESYKVLFKDIDTSLVEQTAPERARGRKLLMSGYDMWLFTKNIKKPVRISLDQKLTGEVSNGDIVRTNYAVDYEATLISEDKTSYKLDLRAKNNKVTYGKIEYVIAKSDFRPLEAIFFAVSGKALKKALFGEFKEIEGMQRSTRVTISDFIMKDKISILNFTGHKKETFNNSLFNKDRLEF